MNIAALLIVNVCLVFSHITTWVARQQRVLAVHFPADALGWAGVVVLLVLAGRSRRDVRGLRPVGGASSFADVAGGRPRLYHRGHRGFHRLLIDAPKRR